MKKLREQKISLLLAFSFLAIATFIGALALGGKVVQAFSYGGHHWNLGNPTYVDVTILSSIPYSWTSSISGGESAWKDNVSVRLDGISGGVTIVTNGRYCSGNAFVNPPKGRTTCP